MARKEWFFNCTSSSGTAVNTHISRFDVQLDTPSYAGSSVNGALYTALNDNNSYTKARVKNVVCATGYQLANYSGQSKPIRYKVNTGKYYYVGSGEYSGSFGGTPWYFEFNTEPITYNISYDFNGGEINPEYGYDYKIDQNVNGSLQTWLYNPSPNTPIKYDNSQYTPSSGYIRNDYFRVSPPIRKGYRFVGWEISGMDSTTHDFWYGNNPPYSTTATSITITQEQSTYVPARHLRGSSGTVIYKALWEPISYNISYNWNGGSHIHAIGEVVEGANSSQYSRHYNPTTVYYDNSQYTPTIGKRHYVFTVDTPTKPGYKFSGWTITNMDNLTPNTSANKDSYAYLYDTSGHGINTDPYTTQINTPAALEFCKLRKTSGTVTFTANWEFRGNYVYASTTTGNTTTLQWKPVVPFIYDGSTWRETQPFVYTSNGWKSLVN